MSAHWWEDVLTSLSPPLSFSLFFPPSLCPSPSHPTSISTLLLPALRQAPCHVAGKKASGWPCWPFSPLSYLSVKRHFCQFQGNPLFSPVWITCPPVGQSLYPRGCKNMICSAWIICSPLWLRGLEREDTQHIWQLIRSHPVVAQRFPPGQDAGGQNPAHPKKTIQLQNVLYWLT